MQNKLKTVIISILLTLAITGSFAQDFKGMEAVQNASRYVASTVLPVVVELDVVDVIEKRVPQMVNPFEFFFGEQYGQRNQQKDEKEDETKEYRQQGLGSGIIVRNINDTYYVLTNNHVVGEADEINVKMDNGDVFTAELVGKDPRKDLALVSFKSEKKLPIAVLGNSNGLQAGDFVFAVGSPLGFGSTITRGIVSALGRTSIQGSNISNFTEYIQTDASINKGNSGGALVNYKGEVIGINTWIASQTGGNIGLGFAIPINNAKDAINDFITKGSVEYGWLGVSMGDLRDNIKEDMGLEKYEGAFVFNVFKDSPAMKSGIIPGDLITKINNTDITGSNDLMKAVAKLPAGKNSNFTVIRNGKTVTERVKTAIRDDEEAAASNNLWPGMSIAGVTPALRKEMGLSRTKDKVMVGNVENMSPANDADLRPGDVIREINSKKIKNLSDFYTRLNEAGKEEMMIKIYRQGRELTRYLSMD